MVKRTNIQCYISGRLETSGWICLSARGEKHKLRDPTRFGLYEFLGQWLSEGMQLPVRVTVTCSSQPITVKVGGWRGTKSMNENIDTSKLDGTSKLRTASRATAIGGALHSFTYPRRRLLLQKLTVVLSTDPGIIRLSWNPKDRCCFQKPTTGLSWSWWILDPYLDHSDSLGFYTVHRPEF
jgi:hypothetical protein